MGKTIKSGAREVIYDVFDRCLAEYQAGKIPTDLDDLYKRVAVITEKSESTVRRIVKEGESGDIKFSTPAKNKRSRPFLDMDDFILCAIRQKVRSMNEQSE